MPSSQPIRRFNDIIQNIDAITRYMAGMTEAQYLADQKTQDATITCLLRISEASKKIGVLAEQLAPDQPWPRIRDIGNHLRHAYHDLRMEQLWMIITDELGPLRVACEGSIARLNRN